MTSFQKKIFLEISIALAIILVLSFALVVLGKNIAKNSSEIVSMRKQLADWTESVQSFALVRLQYNNKAKDYMNILNNVLPRRDSLIELRKEFQFLAAGDNVTMNFSFIGDRQTSSPLIGSVGFSLNLSGSIDGIFEFIRKLDNFQYLLSLDGLTFTRGAEKFDGAIKGLVFFKQ